MRLSYNKRSSFLEDIEDEIIRNRDALFIGTPLFVEMSPQGYNGRIQVKIEQGNHSTFWTDWQGSDPTRFPARIKAAASALCRLGCFGEFLISHESGTLTIQYLGT